MTQESILKYQTKGNICIEREAVKLSYENAVEGLIDQLDYYRGALFASSFEYPGRYTCWDIGFVNPPLVITAQKQKFNIEALNDRGFILLPIIFKAIEKLDAIQSIQQTKQQITGEIKKSTEYFPEELRSKQASIFSILRCIQQLFFSDKEEHLGLYGAFGYDLVFQFESLQTHLPRESDQRDLVLYLPDDIYVVNHRRETAVQYRYEFSVEKNSTDDIERTGKKEEYRAAEKVQKTRDHKEGEYAKLVKIAHESFRRGDLFEVVPGQTFFDPCAAKPSEIFRRLRKRNAAPYGLFINLGQSEYLVGASPEMYVRVQGKQIETCPISGTVARGKDAISDASQILKLLNSDKDASELTMCTDVDRNDKSRICEPGSIKVIGRRQIEMYSRLIHTVDHVVGQLREGYDALDAFLSHVWVVTVTGAPKLWAMKFIEEHEQSPRKWYGGAIGWLGFNGDMNTGLTIRTIRIKNGVAEVRAGATLLFDSDPVSEEQETELKASAFLDAIRSPSATHQSLMTDLFNQKPGAGKRILLIDHQDSFVHTLANYLRQTGAQVITLRTGFPEEELRTLNPDLVVLSPGPGCPKDFNLAATISQVLEFNKPIFGVCLGLQGLIEYFGGELGILSYPMHGKTSHIRRFDSALFSDLPETFSVGRYHSLYGIKEKFPEELRVTAETEDGVIMALEHTQLPIWAVQFHPESILSQEDHVGLKIIFNLMKLI
ncbi:MAG: anthranilate synthase component I [Proteobacteria bacterium]|nr:anthranilate synthase component I [Pseudomonadota bacterium]